MSIEVSPELERLIDEKMAGGRFGSREAVLLHALRLLDRENSRNAEQELSGEERAEALETFFAEVDQDPPSESGPLSEESLSRETFYDTERTRL